MSRNLLPILRDYSNGMVAFWCPGCKYPHTIPTTGSRAWGYNGNPEAPTFTPSVLVTTGKRVDPTYEAEPDDPPECCHSFVTDGRIQFLDDCTHALAGQTVQLPEWPE